MISSRAEAQNQEKRKVFIGLGYRFSIGQDGWTLLKDDDVIADGGQKGKGEQHYRECLDAAIGAATKHHNSQVKEIPVQIPEEVKAAVTAKPTEEEGKPKSIHRRAVQSAIGFLKLSGALYTVEFEGETYTNMPKTPTKAFYQPHYLPLLDKFKGQTEFITSISVPEEFELNLYANALRNELQRRYGAGHYTTQVDKASRTLDIMVSSPPEGV
jgi:hypothetical protein